MKKSILFFLTGIFTITTGLAQTYLAKIDSAVLPKGGGAHYEPEYTLDMTVNPGAWTTEKAGMHISFASTDQLFFRSEVPDMPNEIISWTATGWKGERLNAQILVWSPDTLQQVRFIISDLQNAQGNVLSKNNIQLNKVMYVLSNYPYNAKGFDCEGTPHKDGFLMPDRFEQCQRFDVPGRTVRPVWLSCNIPADAETGEYTGTIEVKTAGAAQAVLHIHLIVQNQVLPKPRDWHHRLDLWQNPWVIAQYYHVKPWGEEHMALLKKHLQLYADAGGTFITTYGVHSPWAGNEYVVEGGMIEWIKQKNGAWRFDYSIFDRYVELAMSVGIDKAITVYTPVPWENRFRYMNEATGVYVYDTWAPDTKMFSETWNVFLDDLKEHLKEKGWLNKAYIGINENPMDQTLAAARAVKKNWSGWKITYAGNWHPELDSLVDDYCFLYGKESSVEQVKARTSRNLTTTYYVCCNPDKPNTFVFSPPVEARWIGWYTAAHGYSGFLRWAYDAWPADPVRDARFGSWAAGDCYLVYPGGNSCIRYEKLREGIVDYEKIRILKDMAAKSTDKNVRSLLLQLNEHLKIFLNEKDFDPAKITSDVEKGKILLNKLSDLLSAQSITDKDQEAVNELMGKMTVEEKIGQLNQLDFGMDITGPAISKDVEQKIRDGKVGSLLNAYTPAVVRKLQDIAVKNTRLHIPLLFGNDVIHGHQTIFPVPLAMSCTWDMPLIERCAQIAAKEASADGLNWTFSPMVDITRDPRWGRVVEGSGEDPYLGSRIAEAMVKGYQGTNLRSDSSILACVKHFALYGSVEAGRDYNTVDMSRIKMYQYYFPPYKAAVDAGAATVMTSFNEIDAMPASGNKWLLDEVLRNQWGFKGLIVTDYAAINEMTAHGLGSLKENVGRAMNAGVDMDMVGEGYLSHLKELLQSGIITIQQIDTACRRILEAKAMLGLLDDPYKSCSEERAATVNLAAAHRQTAREAAARSFVLLKNENGILPLKKGETIALIGPLADDKKNPMGSWRDYGDWKNAVSVLEGIKNAQGDNVRILYAKGCNLIEDDHTIEVLNESGEGLEKDSRPTETMFNEALDVAGKSDIIVAVLGEAKGMTGEAASRGEIGIPENQEDLLKALVKTGKPVVLVLMNGRPLTLSWENDHVAAILETWFGGIEAGDAIADVLFGRHNPSGKLTQCFPLTLGQIPVYYNHKNTGRPFDGISLEKYKSRYFDIPNAPLYTFGYGLSYTTFSYSEVTLSTSSPKGSQTVEASAIVTNTGKYAGEETVQLYISDPVASVTRSVKELKGFKKIFLQPGESKEVTFEITVDDLKFYNDKLKYVWEPGEFIIQIGTNSNDVKSAKLNWTI